VGDLCYNQKMALILFWTKIAIKRMLDIFKSSPIVVIAAMIFIGAFIFAIVNGYHYITLNIQTTIGIISVFICFSLFNSLKTHHTMPFLLRYSKSKFSNKDIYAKFFMKRALANNVWMLVFNVIAYNFVADIIYFIIISGASFFSVLLSFWIMYKKNDHMGKKRTQINTKKPRVNPSTKSILHDYLTTDFLSTAVICTVLFFISIILFTQDVNVFHPDYYRFQSIFFKVLMVIFFFGLLGILGSIPQINWKFQAIISPNDFKYHMKRTVFFLGVIYGWLLVPFVFIGGFVNLTLMLRYLYCISVLFFAMINIAFTFNHIIIKLIVALLVMALTMWASTLSIVFLPVLIIPVIATFVAAKNEYKEWFLA